MGLVDVQTKGFLFYLREKQEEKEGEAAIVGHTLSFSLPPSHLHGSTPPALSLLLLPSLYFSLPSLSHAELVKLVHKVLDNCTCVFIMVASPWKTCTISPHVAPPCTQLTSANRMEAWQRSSLAWVESSGRDSNS